MPHALEHTALALYRTLRTAEMAGCGSHNARGLASAGQGRRRTGDAWLPAVDNRSLEWPERALASGIDCNNQEGRLSYWKPNA